MKNKKIAKLMSKLNHLYAEMNSCLGRNGKGKNYYQASKDFDDTIREIHASGSTVKFDWSIDGIRYFPAFDENGQENSTFRVTKTMRGSVLVSAESEEEAKAKALELLKDGEIDLSEPLLDARCTSTMAE